MKTWNESINHTLPYLNGLGFVNNSGNLIGVTLDTTKEIPIISVAFISLNTLDKYERPDKRTLEKVFNHLGLRNMFVTTVKGIIKYSTVNENIEVRSWPDPDGYFYRMLEIKHEGLDSWYYSKRLLDMDVYENDHLDFGVTLLNIDKLSDTYYVLKGFNYVLHVSIEEDKSIWFHVNSIMGLSVIPINATHGKVHAALSHIYVKDYCKENLIHNENYLISSNMNEKFNKDIISKLEKAYTKQTEGNLSTGKKLSLDVKKAKEQNNPFAVLKTLL
jgi:hypothetical protein